MGSAHHRERIYFCRGNNEALHARGEVVFSQCGSLVASSVFGRNGDGNGRDVGAYGSCKQLRRNGDSELG